MWKIIDKQGCLQDWAKPGPYDQPMVNTLRRRKDKESPAVVDNGSINGNSMPSGQTSISAPPSAQTQTPSQQEEKSRILKVSFRFLLSPKVISIINPKCCEKVFYCFFVLRSNLTLSDR